MMRADKSLLRFDTESIDLQSFNSASVILEINSTSKQTNLTILYTEDSQKILITPDNIAVVVNFSAHFKGNAYSQNPSECLLLIWIWNEEWHHVVITLKGQALQSKKTIIDKLELLSCNLVSKEGVSMELMCTRNYISLVEKLTTVDPVKLLDLINDMKERIFENNSLDFVVEPSQDSVKLSVDQRSEIYNLAPNSNWTANSLCCKIYSMTVKRRHDTLRKIPNGHNGISEMFSGCGEPPLSLEEEPFFFTHLKKWHTLRRRMGEHIKEVLTRKPSDRFTKFIKTVCEVDNSKYQALLKGRRTILGNKEFIDQDIDIYAVPKELGPYTRLDHDTQIEHTLYSIMQRLHETRCAFLSDCPLGLTKEERKKFCLKLEYTEYDVIHGGWKEFAEKIMSMENDDLNMIDEFCVRHAIPPVEVVLEHWYTLSKFKSRKCYIPACKASIISVLKELKKQNLIQEMNWT